MSETFPLQETLKSLPPVWSGGEPLIEIRNRLRKSTGKVVVLDDDPTGTQTVDNIVVVTNWDESTLTDAFSSPGPGFFVLTNSRALNEAETKLLHEEVLTNLNVAANGIPYTIISRSDSTLRGHFLAETAEISEHCGPFELTIFAPFFEAGGRYTLNNQHYVAQDGDLVPAHLTPFADDKVFGYSSSDLREWVEEKTNGFVAASKVVSIDLDTIRTKGPQGVVKLLSEAKQGSICIVNACSQSDMEVVAAATIELEGFGYRILYRTAAAFVAARLGIRPPPPLLTEFISGRNDRAGLIVVGSYVPKTTEQIEELIRLGSLNPIELDVSQLLETDDIRAVIDDCSKRVSDSLARGEDTLLFTSRGLIFRDTAKDNLEIGDKIARAIVSIVSSLETAPGFVITKGGITSSTIATEALKIRKALVLGQVIPGVPVWKSESESRFPELDLVIFPGNVGDKNSLVSAYRKLTRLRSPTA